MSDFAVYLDKIINQHDLEEDQVARAFQIMCLGGASPAQISSFLTSYVIKGFAAQEIQGVSKFLGFKLEKFNNIGDVHYIISDEENQFISIIIALILSSIKMKVVHLTRSDMASFLGYVGINTAHIIDAADFLKIVDISINAAHYKYTLRNIYDVAHEIGLESMIDDLFFFYRPAGASSIIKLCDINNENLRENAKDFLFATHMPLNNMYITHPTKFNSQVALLQTYINNPTHEDFNELNSYIISILENTAGIKDRVQKEGFYSMINTHNIKKNFDSIIEITNKT